MYTYNSSNNCLLDDNRSKMQVPTYTYIYLYLLLYIDKTTCICTKYTQTFVRTLWHLATKPEAESSEKSQKIPPNTHNQSSSKIENSAITNVTFVKYAFF